jgi:hypothetical protein
MLYFQSLPDKDEFKRDYNNEVDQIARDDDIEFASDDDPSSGSDCDDAAEGSQQQKRKKWRDEDFKLDLAQMLEEIEDEPPMDDLEPEQIDDPEDL